MTGKKINVCLILMITLLFVNAHQQHKRPKIDNSDDFCQELDKLFVSFITTNNQRIISKLKQEAVILYKILVELHRKQRVGKMLRRNDHYEQKRKGLDKLAKQIKLHTNNIVEIVDYMRDHRSDFLAMFGYCNDTITGNNNVVKGSDNTVQGSGNYIVSNGATVVNANNDIILGTEKVVNTSDYLYLGSFKVQIDLTSEWEDITIKDFLD